MGENTDGFQHSELSSWSSWDIPLDITVDAIRYDFQENNEYNMQLIIPYKRAEGKSYIMHVFYS